MKNESMVFIMEGRRKRNRRWILVTSFLVVLACVLSCAMLLLGNTIYPVQHVTRALLGDHIQGVSFAVQTIRLPRMVAGVFAGFAFGIAGAVFQTMLRNPLANPNVIGITTGSSAAAVFCIVILHANGAIVSIASVIAGLDRKSTRLNSSHVAISYAVFCLKKKKTQLDQQETRTTHSHSS